MAEFGRLRQHLNGFQGFVTELEDGYRGLQTQASQLMAENNRLQQEHETLKAQVMMLQSQLRAPQSLGAGVIPATSAGENGAHRFIEQTGICIAHTAPVHSVAMSADLPLLASASWDATVKVYHFSSGACKTLTTQANKSKNPGEQMQGLYSVAFSKTAPEVLGCTSVDKYIYLWNHERGELLKALGGDKGHQDEVNSIDFHSSQQVVVTTSDDESAIIWDFQEGLQLRSLKAPHTKAVYGGTFLGPEMQYLVATCCFDRKTRIFDMRDKTVVKTLESHNDDIIGIDFSADLGLLATGSDDGMICIWDTKTWQISNQFSTRAWVGEDNEVKRLAFSRGGDMLAAACSTGCVVVYEGLRSGGQPTQKEKLGGHTDCVFGVAWGADGLLASASHDKTVKLWKAGWAS